MEQPLVSIIIPTYNYGHYLAEAIESALAQNYQNIEVIVVDDGSTDNTKDVASKYDVQYVFQENKGVSVAKNNGVKISKGDFFVCLDADDKIHPNFVSKMIQPMKDPKVGFVRCGSIVYNESYGFRNIWMPRKVFSKYCLFAGWWGALGPVLIRRKAFDSLGSGFDPNLRRFEDLDLCFRLLAKGWKTKAIFEPLHFYRIHPYSTMNFKHDGIDLSKRDVQAINRKYWFREPYRRLYNAYKLTLGKLIMLVFHPYEYLYGINRKIKLKNYIKNEAKSLQTQKIEKLSMLYRETLLTIDMLIEWSYNKNLRDYYIKKLVELELRLQNETKTVNK
ncbi:MAG: glycosyltransferase family 2 protein [Candidatus Aenigmatarchaeota archaeon]